MHAPAAPSRPIRFATLLAITAVLSLGAMAFGASDSLGKALPAGYAPNGCTFSPDRGVTPVYYDFKAQCDRHDYCYDELWYGPGENGRYKCDANFQKEMKAWCTSFYSARIAFVERTKCKGVANVYYKAVRIRGKHGYFDNPNQN